MRARKSGLPRAGSTPRTRTSPSSASRWPFENLDGGRLTGAVGTEEAEDLAAVHGQVDALERLDVLVALAEVAHGDYGFGHGVIVNRHVAETPRRGVSTRSVFYNPDRLTIAGSGVTVDSVGDTLSLMAKTLRVGLAQINTTVGDLEGNVAKVVEYVERARGLGVDIVVVSGADGHGVSAGGPAAARDVREGQR